MVAKKRVDGSGTARQLPSGRWQARFRGPDGRLRAAHKTFDTKLDADVWLKGQGRDVQRGTWSAPSEKRATGTLREYSEGWLEGRDLTPRTRMLYRGILDSAILPDLGATPLERLFPMSVRAWFDSLDKTKPTARAHAYSLLRAILATAVADDLISNNPCRVRGGGSNKTQHQTRTATLSELDIIVETVPPRYKAMVLMAAWCGLRFGELTELRRDDVDVDDARVHVRRGVTRGNASEIWIGAPKSEAGKRSVTMPSNVVTALRTHLLEHTGPEPDALLFPGRNGAHMVPSTLQRVWQRARLAAGRPDLHFHDLRHTGATLAAATGATLADLMARMGHSTAAAALRYQHAAADRDRAIAEALSAFAEAKVIPLKPGAP